MQLYSALQLYSVVQLYCGYQGQLISESHPCAAVLSLDSLLNEEVEFKIPTTRTHNDCLFCCALLRGTARWSLLGGWVEF